MADLQFLLEEWIVISARLDEALALPSAQHAAWLVGLDEPQAVKDKLQRLLAGAPAVENDASAPALPALTLAPDELLPRGDGVEAGALIGPYRLIRELGVGGMGEVWLAERHEGGLKRPVALKLPRVSWTRGLAERMARERDILARLDHPNIAQIFDAGLDASGRPYLALEYVEGEAIDVHCRRMALSVAMRLQLILQVARAVAHAHARLVVHRDLKPANILVTPNGEVRLLDFGIAKLLEGESTRETELTALGGRALTLDYASPEQVRGEPLGAASDVYSLGVVAYELLAGSRPYQLKHQGAAALEEAIASLDVRPASTSAVDAPTRRALRGDLDAILNRALKKVVAQRYATVDALAQDIERHVHGLPVQAQPDSLGYRAGKFLRRNAGPVAMAGVVTMALVAGLSVALWQAHEARVQARRAEAVRAFIKQIFSANDPEQAQGREQSARELLARGAERLEVDLKDQPEVQAELQHEIGDILLAQGANADAKPHFENAIALYERLGTGDSDSAIAARLALADLLGNEYQFDASVAIAERLLTLATRRTGPAPIWALHATALVAYADAQRGKPQAAATALEAALANHRRSGHAPSRETVAALGDLGHAYMSLEQYTKASGAYAESDAEAATVPGVPLADRLNTRLFVQYAHFFLNETEVVLRDLPAVVEGLEQHLGLKSGSTLSARTLWAQSLVEFGRYAQGVKLQQENVAVAEERTALDGSTLAFQRGVLAGLLARSARRSESIAVAQQALAFLDAKYPMPTWTAEQFRIPLGEVQRAAGWPEAALKTLTKAEQRVRTLPGNERSIRYARMLKAQALVKHDLGQMREAAATMAQSLVLYEASWPSDPDTLNTRVMRAWMAARADASDDSARADFDAAARAYAAIRPPEHLAHLDLALLRADLQRQRADSAEARAQWAAATQAWERVVGRRWHPPVSVLD